MTPTPFRAGGAESCRCCGWLPFLRPIAFGRGGLGRVGLTGLALRSTAVIAVDCPDVSVQVYGRRDGRCLIRRRDGDAFGAAVGTCDRCRVYLVAMSTCRVQCERQAVRSSA